MPMLTTLFLMHVFDSDLLIHMYLLDFGFTIDSLITIYITGHYLYLRAWTTSPWSCACLCMPFGFILHTRWVIF